MDDLLEKKRVKPTDDGYDSKDEVKSKKTKI